MKTCLVCGQNITSKYGVKYCSMKCCYSKNSPRNNIIGKQKKNKTYEEMYGFKQSSLIKEKIKKANKFIHDSEWREKQKQGCILKKSGKNHPLWKGDNVSYTSLHEWLHIYKPKSKYCEFCKKQPPFDIALKKGKQYTRNFNDYFWLCRKCHTRYDRKAGMEDPIEYEKD